MHNDYCGTHKLNLFPDTFLQFCMLSTLWLTAPPGPTESLIKGDIVVKEYCWQVSSRCHWHSLLHASVAVWCMMSSLELKSLLYLPYSIILCTVDICARSVCLSLFPTDLQHYCGGTAGGGGWGLVLHLIYLQTTFMCAHTHEAHCKSQSLSKRSKATWCWMTSHQHGEFTSMKQ